MNKSVALIISVVVVIIGGAVFLVTRSGGNDSDTSAWVARSSSQNSNASEADEADEKPATDTKTSVTTVQACDVLTEAVAEQILGPNATKDTATPSTDSADILVSSCIYTAVDAGKIKLVNILVQSAKTPAAAAANKRSFTPSKPDGSQDVSGIGDAAFFDPALGQLHVLKGGNLYIMANYTDDADKGTLESNKQLAALLTFQ